MAKSPPPTLAISSLEVIAESLNPSKEGAYIAPRIEFTACSRPEYPPIALKHSATGISSLAFRVGPDGKVLGADIVKSSGETLPHKVLDISALSALSQCRFAPAKLHGEPIESWSSVEYVWKIAE